MSRHAAGGIVLDGLLHGQLQVAGCAHYLGGLRRGQQLRPVDLRPRNGGYPCSGNDIRHDAMDLHLHANIRAASRPDRRRRPRRRDHPPQMPRPWLSLRSSVHRYRRDTSLCFQTSAPLWAARIDQPSSLARSQAPSCWSPNRRADQQARLGWQAVRLCRTRPTRAARPDHVPRTWGLLLGHGMLIHPCKFPAVHS